MRAHILAACGCILLLGLASAQPEAKNNPQVSTAPLIAPSVGPTAGQGPVEINVNITSFKNRDWVEVAWSGVETPGADDAIAAVFVGMNLTLSVPLRYKFAVRDPEYLSTGSGNLTFQLLNQREDMQFLFFSNLSKSGNFSQAEVIGDYTVSFIGNTTTYTIDEMCGYPANATGWIDPGTINYVLVSGLNPSTKYYYQVGDPSFGYSQEFVMLTGPKVGATSSILGLANADPGHALRDDAYEWEVSLPHAQRRCFLLLLQTDLAW
ncbi:hypothetical protein WJX73_005521 [Symbiochloris irregularis]|uniref:Purple acid phosphatase Fn3-like domain-containing protein n=1 Tax=Symbiochloris irregularis TaxID=706552 RepID=A0AAW1P232_9CHLO